MAHQESLSQWIETVSIQMKDLAPHHATIMALWSFGMVIAQSCGITSVAEDLPMTHIARRRPTKRSRPRLLLELLSPRSPGHLDPFDCRESPPAWPISA